MVMETALEPGATQTVAVGSSAAASTAIGSANAGPSTVRVESTTRCYLQFGSNPTATSASMPFGTNSTNTVEYFTIEGGDKISAIRDDENGTLSITVMS